MFKSIVPNAAQVLDAISDEISFNMFKMIKNAAVTTESLKEALNISAKQCYDRIVILIEIGLVKRNNGYYNMTSFGHVVFEAQAIVRKAIKHRSKLKILDVMKNSNLSKDERTKSVTEFIDDDELREIIDKHDSK